MRAGVYCCRCGQDNDGQVSARIDPEAVRAGIEPLTDVGYFKVINFACAEAGQDEIREHLVEHRPDRVVVAACSPRQHEETFRRVLAAAGINPYLLHLVNIRDQVAWVTEDPAMAAAKAVDQIRAGVARVLHQQPLTVTDLSVCPDVLVVGAGPAGLKAAAVLAEAGRRVTLVERRSILGGLPVLIEDMFPTMECAPCLLEPIIGDVLHDAFAGSIDIRLSATVTAIKGYLGNFDVTVTTTPTHVSTDACVGCGMCVEECPVSIANPVNLDRSERKAIDFELFGGMPSATVIDEAACTRFTADSDCARCRDACPVEGAIRFDQLPEVSEHRAGAVVVAVGAAFYDLSRIGALGYGTHPDILSSWDVERLLAANGPTGGELEVSAGGPPRSIAIVHCAGSLDPDHVPYCSAICCQSAFKYAHLIGKKLAETRIVSYLRTVVAPGKEAFACLRRANDHPLASQRWYTGPEQIEVRRGVDGGLAVALRGAGGDPGATEVTDVDMVILLAPVVPSASAGELARTLDLPVDAAGFLAEHNARTDATRSRVRGISIAGACQAPMDIAAAMTQGAAAAGHALSALVEGRTLPVDPVVAEIDPQRCSGCRTCVPVCPYQAIDLVPDTTKAAVNAMLCSGCGTCVAACPSGAIQGHHFTDRAIYAEIEAVLQP